MGTPHQKRRILLSRIGALCLLVLGVHSASEFFNNIAFQMVDALDLAVDQFSWGVLHKLASLSLLESASAVEKAESIARWVDFSEKETAAAIFGIVTEASCVLLLTDYAWGFRPLRSDLSPEPSTDQPEPAPSTPAPDPAPTESSSSGADPSPPPSTSSAPSSDATPGAPDTSDATPEGTSDASAGGTGTPSQTTSPPSEAGASAVGSPTPPASPESKSAAYRNRGYKPVFSTAGPASTPASTSESAPTPAGLSPDPATVPPSSAPAPATTSAATPAPATATPAPAEASTGSGDDTPKKRSQPRFRFEALWVTMTLTAFTMSGLFFLAVTVEESFFAILQPYPTLNRYGVPAGAGLGILLGLLCLCRFLPDMLLGAYHHSMRRIAGALPPPKEGQPLVQRVKASIPRYGIVHTRRGGLILFPLLPLALFGLLASIQLNVAAISTSFGTMP